MSAIAPERIYAAHEALARHPKRPRSYRFGGISGDAAHSFGYHVDPEELGPGDYSLQLWRDHHGAGEHPRDASAWDISLDDADMRRVTRRLLDACRADDPRVKGVREFCGTLDGRNTYPWDHHGNSSEGINSWDDSHLWHVHISFYRDAPPEQILAVVDVVCGVRKGVPNAVRSIATRMARGPARPDWPLAEGHYFGPIDGPDESHGGFFPAERNYVHRIQRRLQWLGYAPSWTDAPEWADGKWEPETTTAVRRWQAATQRAVTGVVGPADWKALLR